LIAIDHPSPYCYPLFDSMKFKSSQKNSKTMNNKAFLKGSRKGYLNDHHYSKRSIEESFGSKGLFQFMRILDESTKI